MAANVNMPSDFPRHHRATSPDRAGVLMVVLVTIASVVVCGWIAVWLLSDVGAAWPGPWQPARRDAPSADEGSGLLGWTSVGRASVIRTEHSWRCQMAVSYQLVIDCTSPEPLVHFWAEALHYVIAPPPPDFNSWDDFYRSIGVPEDELGNGPDSIRIRTVRVRASGSRSSPRRSRSRTASTST